MADTGKKRAVGLIMTLVGGVLLSMQAVGAASVRDVGKVDVPRRPSACHFSAWVSFRAHGTIPVRSAPRPSATIIGVLPTLRDGDDESAAVEFDVVAAQPGWLKVDHLSDPNRAEEDRVAAPRGASLPRSGWIAADVAQVGVQSARGYSRPDAASRLILDLGDDWLTDMGQVDAIRGCSGEWLLLDYRVTHRRGPSDALIAIAGSDQPKGTAWFRGICSNQYTTCDMSSVDRPQKRDTEMPGPRVLNHGAHSTGAGDVHRASWTQGMTDDRK